MKILKLELNNFRQYYGYQEISFSTDPHRNTTIIFGENGKGKTGIYRALMFGLFGTKEIPQDNSAKELHLVNYLYLKEAPSNMGKATVTVEFEHENEYYIISREVIAQQIGNNITERDGSRKLYFKDKNGHISHKTLEDEQSIKSVMNKILDEQIKDFFLFDAEKIDTLTKEDKEVRAEVKKAILNLLQMDNLYHAEEILKNIRVKVQRKLKETVSDDELNSLEHKKDQIKNELTATENLIKELEKEDEQANGIIEKHQLTLSKNAEILDIQKKNQENVKEIETLKSNLIKINNTFAKEHLLNAPYLIMEKTLYLNAEEFRNYLGEEQLNIPKNLMEVSLKKNHCVVCNANFELHREQERYVKSLLDSYNYSASFDLMNRLVETYNERKDNFTYEIEKLVDSTKSYKETIDRIKKLQEAIDTNDKEIKKFANIDIDLSAIQKIIDEEKAQKKRNEINIGVQKKELKSLETDLEELNSRIDILYATQSKDEQERRKLFLLSELEGNLKHISKDFNFDMRRLLGDETTSIFKMLIDPKDKELIKTVEINEKLEIKVIGHNNITLLNNLSQGQGQILSLAFITALAKLAVKNDGKNTIDYPLFMDSPFNRLSGKNRDGLITKIPDLTAQWILLLTDTEFTISEERVFKEHERLGKWYRIEQVRTNYSVIQEVDLTETIATRGI